MKGKFEEAMAEAYRPKPAQIILNILLFSGIAFFVLFCIGVATGVIK